MTRTRDETRKTRRDEEDETQLHKRSGSQQRSRTYPSIHSPPMYIQHHVLFHPPFRQQRITRVAHECPKHKDGHAANPTPLLQALHQPTHLFLSRDMCVSQPYPTPPNTPHLAISPP